MAQKSKKSHYVFDRYIRTPQPGSTTAEGFPEDGEIQNLSIIQQEPDGEIIPENQPIKNEDHEQPLQRTVSMSLAENDDHVAEHSRTSGDVTRVQSSVHPGQRSSKSSRVASSRVKSARTVSKPQSRVSSKQSSKPGSVQSKSRDGKIVSREGSQVSSALCNYMFLSKISK